MEGRNYDVEEKIVLGNPFSNEKHDRIALVCGLMEERYSDLSSLKIFFRIPLRHLGERTTTIFISTHFLSNGRRMNGDASVYDESKKKVPFLRIFSFEQVTIIEKMG